MEVLRGAFLLLLMAGLLAGQSFVPGPQSQVYISDVDGTAQPYALYVPRDFDPSRKYPLVVSLHSEGSNHRLDLRRLFGRGNLFRQTDAEAANGPFPRFPDVNYLVVSPLSRGSMGYQGIPEKDVYDVLSEVKKNFPIDEDRVYLTGASMGGGGALWLALTRPDIWAAVAVLCPTPLPGAEELASNGLNLPVRLFQGNRDRVVEPESTREWRDRLQVAGAKVELTEYPLVRHDVWDYAYKGTQIFPWFSQFTRTRFPTRVQFTTDRYEYNAAYWVRIDGLTPGSEASLSAEFRAPNRIAVKTQGLDGFSFRLGGHPSYDSSKPLYVSVDATSLKLGPKAGLSFSRTDKEWAAQPYTRSAAAKGPGQEGPIAAALARKHIYVYGTADSPDDEELARRRAQAELAAKWDTPPLPLLLTLHAVADRDVTAEDLTGANLVLFGTRQTNSLIASLGSRLPLELNPSAADYGLIAIAPAGDRYIVVNSGLTWWAGTRTNQPPYKALLELGDYVVFRRTLDNVVAEGRFDRNWKVTSADAAMLAAAGVVLIR